MKGIILAAGTGSRLHPATLAMSKHLLPVYDKPMIYYPLSTLMLAGIREILLITTPEDQPLYRRLLGDGDRWGLSLHYAVQPRPEGLAQALLIGREFADGGPLALALGDNIFYGHGLPELLWEGRRHVDRRGGAVIYAYHVRDPQRFGIVELAADGRPVSLEEKPAEPRSNWAVTGLYFYDADAPDLAATLRPSGRGELEITDLNRLYLEMGRLKAICLGRGFAWLDAGTPGALLDAGLFIRTLAERQGLQVACLEEIAYRLGYIDRERLEMAGKSLKNTPYGHYLLKIAKD